MLAERQRHLAAEVLDRADLFEDFLETGGSRNISAAGVDRVLDATLPVLVAQQPVEGLSLQVEHVWYFKGFADLAERNAVRGLGELSRAAKEILPRLAGCWTRTPQSAVLRTPNMGQPSGVVKRLIHGMCRTPE